ncbi:VacJ family lipoprotein [Panacagrimonas sp.]|uniref:MlaA family lipoprotein n=1 Tax=Panacagrimonas sp. TaxID=2480088 RepID=UPI003B51E2E0
MSTALARLLACSAVACLVGCAHLPPDEPSDPLEPVNRGIYKFNRGADRYVLRPVAKGYRDYVPVEIRGGVSNFLDNLFYPTVIVNDLLQGKFAQGGKDLGRFVLNTTVGIVGIMDVATPLGLPANNEDLGQTFGRWGAGEGWYLMLPLLGPSNSRDLVGRVGDAFTSPTAYVETEEAIAIGVVGAVDARTQLLDADKILDEQFDPYIFIRTAYLQRRQSLVFDGNPPKHEYDFGEDEDEDEDEDE